MDQKLNEFAKTSKDPNSPESQDFLLRIHNKSIDHQEKMVKMLRQWQEEDKKNAINRNK